MISPYRDETRPQVLCSLELRPSLTKCDTGSRVTLEAIVMVHIAHADIHDADTVATMVGELLQDIMTAANDKGLGFHHADTVERAGAWMKEGRPHSLAGLNFPY